MKWYWIVAIVVAVLAIIMSRRGENANKGPALPNVRDGEGTEADMDAFIRAGHKIQAIKIYRTLHNVGLKDAKDAVDAREREMKSQGLQQGGP